MKRPITYLVAGCLVFFAMQLAAQPTFTVSPQMITANQGDNITVNVTVSNFTNILSFQYSMNWPAAVLQFVPPVGNVTNQLGGFTAANFNSGSGFLSVSWFDPDVVGATLPNGTILYSLTFQVLTTAPATISFSGTPTIIEVVNSQGNTVNPVFQNGSVNGGNTGGGGGGGGVNGFAVIASDKTVASGSPVCVDVTVNDFIDILSMQYTMKYDQTKFQFTGVQGFGLPGLTAANFNAVQAQGTISFSWLDPDEQGLSVPNGTVIYQVCFNATGPNSCGSTTQFQFTGTPTPIEVEGANGPVTFGSVPGNLEICGGAPPGALTFIASEETSPNGSQVCVDFSVNNFNCIVSAQYTIQFNPAILQYNMVQGFGLPDLTAANFGTGGAANGNISFSWFDQTTNGITLPNGSVIFQVCFNVIGSNGQSSNINFTGNPTIVEVVDCNGQVQPVFDSGSVTVGTSCAGPLSITNSVITNVLCFGQSTGSINITVAGGSAQKVYTWKNAGGTTVGTSEDLTGVPAGTYSVTITSCNGQEMTTASYTITQPSVPLGVNQQLTNVACFGENLGVIDITVTGGTPTGPGCNGYSYLWSNGLTTQDLNNLAPGMYTVTITDCNGCTLVTEPMTISGPPSVLEIQAVGIPVKCFGGNSGSIMVTGATGGSGTYEYSLNNGPYQASTTFANLTAGTYTVNVRDGFNCVKSTTVTVGSPNDISITTLVDNATSGNCDGSIWVSVSGGTPGGAPPGYTFSWSGPSGPIPGNPQNAQNLCPGNYCVTVTDFNGCTKTACRLVSAPLSVALANKKDACFNTCNGSINLDVVGGVPPLTFSWSNAANTQDLANLCPGSYTVTVTSTGNNTTQTLTVNITQATSSPSIVSATVQDPTSSTNCNGSVTINSATGGFGQPYTYTWSNGQNGLIASNLCDEVSYTVTVSDAQGCTGTAVYTPDFNPAPLTPNYNASPSCQNTANGSVNIQLVGGTVPFSVTIVGPSGSFTQTNLPAGTATFNNLLPGTYNVNIVDGATGQDQQSETTTVEVPSVLLTIDPIIVIPATSTTPGSIDITPGGGALPYAYVWSHGSIAQDPTGLAPGTFQLTMNDGNGCFQVFNVTVGLFKSELANLASPTCPDETGSISIVASGSDNTPYSYVWRNAAGQIVSQSAELQNQPVGTYTVSITDSQGTVITQTYTITPVSNLQADAVATSNFNGFNVRCHNGTSGAAAVTASNGATPYSYAWSTGSGAAAVSGLSAGVYSVTVTDAQGCKVIDTVNILQPPSLVLDTEGSLGSCSDNSGIASVFVSGGVPVYSYVWNDPQNQKTPTAILLRGGTYRVTVTDANQCTAIRDVVIPSPVPISIIGSSVPDSGGPNGQAIAQVVGGTWPFDFEWQLNGIILFDKDSILTELSPGDYIVIVTDAIGCVAYRRIAVGDETQCGEVLTVITPEGDKLNDEFRIGCLSRFTDNRLEIYNRWGQLVFDVNNYNDGNLWRGTDRRGNDVPDGVYFYVFDYLDPATNQRVVRKGNVTVLRK